MSNLVGIDFFRLVSEGSIDDWAQVYARVPFEEKEVEKKGALFGVVRLKGGKELVSRGTEIFSWLDEHFNKIERGGDLRALMEELEKKDEELEAVWLWVSLEEGKRVLRVMGVRDGKVDIFREGQRVSLVEKERLGQVVKGELREGDKLMMGVGGMVDLKIGGFEDEESLEKTAEELKEKMEKNGGGAMAGLMLEIGMMKKDLVGSDEQSEEKGDDSEKKKGTEEGEKDEEKSEKLESENEKELEREAVDEKKEEVEGRTGELGEVESNEVKVGSGAGVKIEAEREKGKGWWGKTSGGVKVRRKEGGEKKLLYLGGLFLVLFLGSVAFGSVKMKQKKEEEAWLAVVEPWEKKEEEALALVEANPVGARELLKGVMEEVEEKEVEYVETKYEDDFEELKLRLEESWKKVSGESEVKTEVVVSLELLRNDLQGERLVGVGDGMVLVLDSEKGVVVEVELTEKAMEISFGQGENEGWKDVAGDESGVVVMKDEGLEYEFNGSEGELEFDGSVLAPVGVEVFANGVYVLDGGAEEIWKFARSGNELEERRRWLESGEELGVSGVVDMDIDGDIWVLSSEGGVSRLRRGYEESYSLSGGPDDLKGVMLAVSSDGERLVILDRENERLVEFDKETGEYVKQLVGEKIGKMDDVMVTEDDKLLGLGEGELFYLE